MTSYTYIDSLDSLHQSATRHIHPRTCPTRPPTNPHTISNLADDSSRVSVIVAFHIVPGAGIRRRPQDRQIW